MWFRNLHLYHLSAPFPLSPEQLAEKLAEKRFQPCARQAELSLGWISPIHRNKDHLVHAANGCVLFCMRREQKVIPASAVKEALEERVLNIQTEMGRKVYSKEKQSLKEDILSQMLPNAFTKATHISAYIDNNHGHLLVNAASAAMADAFIELLVETIGSFGAVKWVAEENPALILNDWLENGLPEAWSLTGEYELKHPVDERVAKFKDYDAENPVLGDLLAEGYWVSKLGVYYKGLLKATLVPDLQVKGVKFMDELLAENDDVDDDEMVKFDADFVLMTRTLAEFIESLGKDLKVNI